MNARLALAASVALAFAAMATDARAQSGALTIRAASGESMRIDAGSVATSSFTVKNNGADTVRATPNLVVPRGWTVVMGGAPLVIAPGAMDTWLVGIAIPSGAAAQSYVVRASLATARDSERTSADSIVVR
ncbi:MAG TPA: NEW3 domain-containing protein, partial [Gemmatimonadaceae bacterium]|nr:NEW3 domain-containing protein [Gemmatimonadaceae bacterium]